ncbi:hypothetical protein B5X24_HaOG211485 [Helicoverpa armigera]|nr:hypothetical protein B5X24_HaOG211485 [Helicoverpa armigera]
MPCGVKCTKVPFLYIKYKKINNVFEADFGTLDLRRAKTATKRRKKNKQRSKENGKRAKFYYLVSRPPFVVVEN